MKPNRLIVRKEGVEYLVFDVASNKIRKCTDLPSGFSGNVIENDPVQNSPSAPLKLYIDITNRCNIACSHCLSASGSGCTDEISWPILNGILDWCLKKGVFRIKLGGGEPLIHPNFWDVSKKVSEYMTVSTSSNGILVDEKVAQRIKDYDIKISISMDGDEAKHDLIRGRGVYKRAVNALKLLRSVNANVSIRFTMFDSATYSNIDTIDSLISLSQSLDVPLKIIRGKSCGRSIENNLGMVKPTKKYFELAEKIKNTSADVEVEGILCSDATENDYLYKNFFDCGAGTRDLRIGPNLMASPCAFLEEYYPVGKVNTYEDLDNIWANSPSLVQLRKVFLTPNQQCKSCCRKWQCNGGCRNLVLAAGRPENGVDPCCPIENALSF